MTRYNWNTPVGQPQNRILHWEGGCYLVQRDRVNSRTFRAYTNGVRTVYTGTREECMLACERAIAQARLVESERPSPAQPGEALESVSEMRDLIDRIRDALGTDERGENLVAVARDAHRAEQELAALRRETEEN